MTVSWTYNIEINDLHIIHRLYSISDVWISGVWISGALENEKVMSLHKTEIHRKQKYIIEYFQVNGHFTSNLTQHFLHVNNQDIETRELPMKPKEGLL